MNVALVALVAAGVVLLVVSRRSYAGELKPNGSAGLRTKATQRSDAAWYAGQRAAAPANTVGGVAALVGTVAATIVDVTSSNETAYAVVIGVTIAVIVASGVVGWIAGNRAANAAPDDIKFVD